MKTVDDMINVTERILRDMNEGLMVLERNGEIFFTNAKAQEVLGRSGEELDGKPFASVFFGDERNDAFIETILDAVYDPQNTHRTVAPYYAGDEKKYLHVITSSLMDGEKRKGIIVLLSDITELVEVKEHLKMMQEIEKLNKELQSRNDYIRYVLGRYLSDEIADKILDTPGGLSMEGTLSNITVLMSDLRGFTAMCEQMDPAPLIHMLNHYFDHMGKIIREMRGTVIEYVGDGILAIFGDPIKLENHAETAVTAAVRMQLAMEEINRWNREQGYPEVEMGIGINTGDAVIGNIGSEYVVKYNVIGSSVNLCGRIEGYTCGGQILISEESQKMIGSELITNGRFEVTPKGVKDPVTIWSVRGLGAPYNLSCDAAEEEIVMLEKEEKALLQILEGKQVTGKKEPVLLIGRSARRILLRSSAEMEVFDNAVLRTCENGSGADIYGKIVKREGDVYTMVITATADGRMK